jgi:hypothetical protein
VTVALRTNNHNAVTLPDDSDHASAQLIQWAQAADAAFALANRLCTTQFAPAAYRGRVEEATAAIIAGAEVGLSPMASLRAFDVIQGTPAPKAVTLRAIVQSRGHEVVIKESNPDRAVVVGRRKGDEDWQTSVWDVARAQRMGLTEKAQWKQQPGAMLVARATAEVCRWIAADAIMGMPYTAEEVGDGGGEVDVRPAPRRVSAREVLDEPQPGPVEPPAADVAVEGPIMPDQRQLAAMFATLNEANLKDKAVQLDFIAEVIGRRIESRKELTADEVAQIRSAARALVPPQDGVEQA